MITYIHSDRRFGATKTTDNSVSDKLFPFLSTIWLSKNTLKDAEYALATML
jgi:hypothetical protein